eukprot:3216497-Rhodomonas_salina.3
MWLFGGYGGEGQSRAYLSDLVCLTPANKATGENASETDRQGLEWTYPQTSGTLPRARSAHSASMVGLSDLHSARTRLKIEDAVSTNRAGLTNAALMDRCMILAGGRDQNGIRSDAFVLNLDTVLPSATLQPPLPLTRQRVD